MPVVCGVNNYTPAAVGASGTDANFMVAFNIGLGRFLNGLGQELAAFNAWAAQPCPGQCPVKAPANPQPALLNPYFRVRVAKNGKFTCSFGVIIRGSFRCSPPAAVGVVAARRGGRQRTAARTRKRSTRTRRG